MNERTWHWCCRHAPLLCYIAVVVTLLLISTALEILGVW